VTTSQFDFNAEKKKKKTEEKKKKKKKNVVHTGFHEVGGGVEDAVFLHQRRVLERGPGVVVGVGGRVLGKLVTDEVQWLQR